MILQANLALFPDERPAVMVVSHERSGTHFLMNSLAACYGYVSQPWINFDQDCLNINYYHPAIVREALLALAAKPMANVVKSHHTAEFFRGELGRLSERYIILVICRDPVAVMISHWRLVHRCPWHEGPKTLDPISFARAEPSGWMMRYQQHQLPNMMSRWAAHIESWRAAAAGMPRIAFVRYEDLDRSYEATMRCFAPLLGRPPHALIRPARDYNVVPAGPPDPTGTGIPPDTEGLRRLCRATVGETMARMGY